MLQELKKSMLAKKQLAQPVTSFPDPPKAPARPPSPGSNASPASSQASRKEQSKDAAAAKAAPIPTPVRCTAVRTPPAAEAQVPSETSL